MNWIMSETSGKLESGQGMVEYGLILVLVSIVAIATLSKVGSSLNTKFDEINTKLENKEGTTGTPGGVKNPEDVESPEGVESPED